MHVGPECMWAGMQGGRCMCAGTCCKSFMSYILEFVFGDILTGPPDLRLLSEKACGIALLG